MKTVRVHLNKIQIAATRWYEFHGLKSISTWHYLKFLGEEEQAEKLKHCFLNRITHPEIEVTEESARKIEQLNGPHYKTLLAIYKAQNMIK